VLDSSVFEVEEERAVPAISGRYALKKNKRFKKTKIFDLYKGLKQ
jgi:hypothetical protein